MKENAGLVIRISSRRFTPTNADRHPGSGETPPLRRGDTSGRLRPPASICGFISAFGFESSFELRVSDLAPGRITPAACERRQPGREETDRTGRTVPRRPLIEALGHDFLSYDERRLEVGISRLRKKIKHATGADAPLRSEWGLGYAFTEPCVLI